MACPFCGQATKALRQWRPFKHHRNRRALECVILFGTAIFHATGYTSVARAMGASEASPALTAAMKPLWRLVYSTQAANSASNAALGEALDVLAAILLEFRGR